MKGFIEVTLDENNPYRCSIPLSKIVEFSENNTGCLIITKKDIEYVVNQSYDQVKKLIEEAQK